MPAEPVLAIEIAAGRISAAVAIGEEIQAVDLAGADEAGVLYVGEDGVFTFGPRALALGVHTPARLVADLPALLSDRVTLIGEQPVSAGQVLRALVDYVTDAQQRQSEMTATEIRIIAPARWGPRQVTVLASALSDSGLDVVMVPAAMAAAQALNPGPEPGSLVAIVDCGANAVSCSVLERGAAGYQLVAAPIVDLGLGTDLLDERLLAHLTSEDRAGVAAPAFLGPQTAEERRALLEFRVELSRVRDRLSATQAVEFHVPGSPGVQITRNELETAIKGDIEAIAELAAAAVARAGYSPSDLSEVVLSGAAARTSLLSSVVWRRLQLHRPPTVLGAEDALRMGQPDSSLLTGALAFEAYQPARAGFGFAREPSRRAPIEKPPPAPFGERLSQASREFRSGKTVGQRVVALRRVAPTSQKGRLISLGSVVGVIVLLVVLVGSGGSPPKHPSVPASAGAAAVQAAQLTSVVPASIAKSCQTLSKKSAGVSGYAAGVSCTSSDDPGFSIGVYYLRFETLADAKKAFATDLQVAGASFGTGDCNNAASFPAECSWAVEGEKGNVGELAYYNLAATSSEPAASFLEWTIDRSKAVMSVISRTVSDPNLRTWFDDCGGLGGTTVEERCASGSS